MEYFIQTFGAKFCCIFASGCGAGANILTKKQFNITALKDIALATVLVVGAGSVVSEEADVKLKCLQNTLPESN